ncbi:MAG: FAD-dependent oxidoreductase [Eubacteriales bacterium]|nr:FAD-dependent oxidoreductase [Eubacteriales bacterium]
MLRINQIKIPVKEILCKNCSVEQELLIQKANRILKGYSFEFIRISKKSIDARDKKNLMYSYSIDIKSKDESLILKRIHNNNIMSTKDVSYQFPFKNSSQSTLRPVIVGAGPAGYFCALYLARNGYRPIVIERGKKVEERMVDVNDFWNSIEKINPNSNVSFGEGGAGTFSDGKLNTGIKDPHGRIEAVLKDFVSFGANKEILYLNKPHIGTDILCKVMKHMRDEIISNGGDIRFSTQFTDYHIDDNHIISIVLKNSSEEYVIKSNALILALGHSARDTFRMLASHKLSMEPKAFAVGLRIEHSREIIDIGQYGKNDIIDKLPAADYKMTYRSSEGRSVYSFCMCPGGFVVNASSNYNQSVVNGMSNHARNEKNSNSAIVVNVTPEDFKYEGFDMSDPLAGMYFQEKYEALAYKEGKGNIPIQLFDDYENGRLSTQFGMMKPNIKGAYTFGNLKNCLPHYVNNAIIEGIHAYAKKLSEFDHKDAVLSGIESRTSSPIRIHRNEQFMSDTIGIFPCGEGAGYAGGITSAAVDGIKVAEAVAQYMIKQETDNE